MQSFRSTILENLGIEHEYAAVTCNTIRVQRRNEREPFAEIRTDSKGRTVFSVGTYLIGRESPVIKTR
jgi:hypothetical protein